MARHINVNPLIFANFARRPRVFHNRINHLGAMTSEELRARYRFGLPALNRIFEIVNPELEDRTLRNQSISKEMQILIALRYYATGDHLSVIGDTFGVHKSTVSRALDKVTDILSSKLNEYVTWPTPAQRRASKREFYNMAGFPAVIGCVDGTHIRIQAPTEYEPDYVNRKRYHSINVQGVCDHAGKFTNIVARWPGSTHDSHVFRTSQLCAHMERTHTCIEDGILLGDSGYRCRRFLITPYLRPSRVCEERFNAAHKKTRTLIERTFGRWKKRFQCLHAEMRFAPEKVCRIILACAVLHNIAIQFGEPEVDVDQPQMGDLGDRQLGAGDGFGVRNRLAEVYFS